jgi:hypothetical protein
VTITAFQCPHCQRPLPLAPPGLVTCPNCRRAARIPAPGVLEQQRQKDKQVAMIIGILLGVIYGAPLLMVCLYLLVNLIFVVIMLIVGVAGAAAS